MLNFIKSKLKKNEKNNTNKKNNELTNNIIEVQSEDSFTLIKIKKECTLEEYSSNIDKYDEVKDLHIPIRLIYQNKAIEEKNVYIFKHNNFDYVVTTSNKNIKISERKLLEDNVYETEIEINKENNDYTITEYIHNDNLSTKSVKWYPATTNYFSLDKKEAFDLVRKTLDNLNSTPFVDKIFDNINNLYELFNLIPKSNYYPIINDDLITLSWPIRFNNDDINKNNYATLDIALNETREKIGQISYYYSDRIHFNYGGNVSYEINKDFQNNHYATRALTLLKNVLTKNEFKGDKNLYIATLPENVMSQKVAKNNDGKLIYDGEVPEENALNYIDGVKNVKIYCIKIPKYNKKNSTNI